MSDHERGAYAPPTGDAPLSFDPREPVRGASPIPVTLILSVLVLAAVVAAVFVFYRSGVREAAEAPVVVGAPVGAIRSAAPNEAQPQDPAASLQIYRADAPNASDAAPPEPRFVPPPEQPQIRALPPARTVTVPPPTQASVAQSLKPAIAAPPAAKPLIAKLPEVKKPPAPVTKVEALMPKPVTTPKPVVAKAPTPDPKAAASGGAVVQIGAVGSPALADKAWGDAVAAAPGMAAGKGKSVQKIEGGTLYRTFVTGFASKGDAQAFCAKLQASGKSCFVR